MGSAFYFDWEVKLIETVQALFPEWFIKFLKIITECGDIAVAVGVIGLMYWCIDCKKGRKVALTAVMAMTTFPLIKNIFLRIRPYMAHDTVKCLKPVTEGDIYSLKIQGYSFPSGHSAISMSLFGSLFKEYAIKALRIVVALIVLFVGISRFTVGVHYPTDVLAGWSIGLVSIFVVDYLEKHFKPKFYYPVIWIIMAAGMLYCHTDDYFTAYGALFGFTIGDLVNERLGGFEKPKKFWWGLLRILGGVGIYFAISTLMKMPLSEEFLESGTFAANIYRTLRYALSIFASFGPYPQLFNRIEGRVNR